MPYGEAVSVHIADGKEQPKSKNSKLSHVKHITLSCLQNPSFKFRLGVYSPANHHSVQNSTPPCLFQTQWHLHIPPTIPLRNSCTMLAVCIQGVSKMLGKNSGVTSPSQNKEKISYQYMSASRFRGTVQQRVDLKPLDFYIWGNLKHPSVFICN
jgi:hypothetical protein